MLPRHQDTKMLEAINLKSKVQQPVSSQQKCFRLGPQFDALTDR